MEDLECQTKGFDLYSVDQWKAEKKEFYLRGHHDQICASMR